jgi:hypothetical protein
MISLVDWHIALNRVSGAMVLKFHKAEPADLRAWATALRQLANAMDAAGALAEGVVEEVGDDAA